MIKKQVILKTIIYAICATILFVQETLLSVIPNFQFTTLLIVLFFNMFGFKATTLIIITHVILDNIWMQSLNLIYTPAMFLGWFSLPLILKLIPKRKNYFDIALIGAFHGVLYSFFFVLAQVFLTQVDIMAYLIADIPFTLILMMSNFITILWLYQPLYTRLKPLYDEMINKYN
mgnify:CR=1 FL=1